MCCKIKPSAVKNRGYYTKHTVNQPLSSRGF